MHQAQETDAAVGHQSNHILGGPLDLRLAEVMLDLSFRDERGVVHGLRLLRCVHDRSIVGRASIVLDAAASVKTGYCES